MLSGPKGTLRQEGDVDRQTDRTWTTAVYRAIQVPKLGALALLAGWLVCVRLTTALRHADYLQELGKPPKATFGRRALVSPAFPREPQPS